MVSGSTRLILPESVFMSAASEEAVCGDGLTFDVAKIIDLLT